jgi:SAM-dependent methyltransferase
MTESYYDNLAPYYQYIYQDWDASIQRQAAALDGVIREYFGENVKTILDAACGVGTQAIGLAQIGYTITASDISPREIGQAWTEANQRGLTIQFGIADMRKLWSVYQKQFDLVIACDNAIPHLLSDQEILTAFEQFYRCTAPSGGCLISVRDYAKMDRTGKKLFPRTVHQTGDHRFLLFDLWEFEGLFYDFTTYIIEDCGQNTANTTIIRGGRYYCVEIPTLEKLLLHAGFHHTVTLRDRFFQPLVIGIKKPS